MRAFDVHLNGRKVCRAGVGHDGVLTAIVTWTRSTATNRPRARREDLDLHVGGLIVESMSAGATARCASVMRFELRSSKQTQSMHLQNEGSLTPLKNFGLRSVTFVKWQSGSGGLS
jgi:hypothetical protein